MILKNVKYILSAPNKKYWLADDKKEICIVGRSNVGKSTFINKITNNKNMAKTSKTPGLTKYLNFFDVDNKFLLVDTPGYGYAKASIQKDESFAKMMDEYLSSRKNLVCVIMIIDSKIGFSNDDLLLLELIKHYHLNLQLICSKFDKTNQSQRHFLKKQIQEVCNEQIFKNTIYYSSFDKNVDNIIQRILYIYQNSKA